MYSTLHDENPEFLNSPPIPFGYASCDAAFTERLESLADLATWPSGVRQAVCRTAGRGRGPLTNRRPRFGRVAHCSGKTGQPSSDTGSAMTSMVSNCITPGTLASSTLIIRARCAKSRRASIMTMSNWPVTW